MNPETRRVDLDRAKAGMVLAEPVMDRKKTVLLPKGTILSTGLLAGLARRGISHVVVTADAEAAHEDLDARKDAAILRVAHLFRRTGDDPTTRALEAALMDYRTGNRT